MHCQDKSKAIQILKKRVQTSFCFKTEKISLKKCLTLRNILKGVCIISNKTLFISKNIQFTYHT